MDDRVDLDLIWKKSTQVFPILNKTVGFFFYYLPAPAHIITKI